MELLIDNGTIVNEGERFSGYIIVKGDRIASVGKGRFCGKFCGEIIDAKGLLVMPGVIDDQVHFREPGLTQKADIHTESRAALAGGVTSFMDMPNTNPPTISLAAWEQKMEIASKKAMTNYAFYLGATNDNIKVIAAIDPKAICGVKLFMGSSTGNMLVDRDKALCAIFEQSPVLVAAHCEHESIIKANIDEFKRLYGDNITPQMHPLIRSAEACYRSSAKAVELADKYGTDLHLLHISTERELTLFDKKPLEQKRITNEVCVHHLWFSDRDYAQRGNIIKWNPAIKTIQDRDGLREGLLNGKIDVVATDHAPHTWEEKQNSYWSCPSGAPMIQHSLVAMLEIFAPELVAQKMCHAPAKRFRVKERGFLREGMYADIAIVNPDAEWSVEKSNILYKCEWSPMEGVTFRSKVEYTIINGVVAYKKGEIREDFIGKSLEFY